MAILLRHSPGGVQIDRFKNTRQTYWDDLRFPAGAVNPPGLASDPDFDTTNGGWLFDSTLSELLFFQVQLSHRWREGSDINPHIHWQKSTSASGTVKWVFDYKWTPIGEVMDAAFTTVSSTDVVAGTPDTDEADKHLITSFGPITTEGREVSDMLMVKVSRDPSGDTYGADARLLEFDVHFQVDSWGTIEEFTK